MPSCVSHIWRSTPRSASRLRTAENAEVPSSCRLFRAYVSGMNPPHKTMLTFIAVSGHGRVHCPAHAYQNEQSKSDRKGWCPNIIRASTASATQITSVTGTCIDHRGFSADFLYSSRMRPVCCLDNSASFAAIRTARDGGIGRLDRAGVSVAAFSGDVADILNACWSSAKRRKTRQDRIKSQIRPARVALQHRVALKTSTTNAVSK